jgi:hypothetical protein
MLLVPKAMDVGCFGPSNGATLGMAFGWETLMTMTLVVSQPAGPVNLGGWSAQ